MKPARSMKNITLLAASLGLIIIFLALIATIVPRGDVPSPMTGKAINYYPRMDNPEPLTDYSINGLLSRFWPLVDSRINITRIPFDQSQPASFRQFAASMMNGNADQVRGVYVQGLMALAVVQQPVDEVTYVAAQMDIVTQFQSAADHNVIGLLAHNYLSGSLFYQLTDGAEVRIVFGDGSYQRYQVSGSYAFQKLDPHSLQSDLVDMETETVLTTNQVFNHFYSGEHHVTFQTCLEEGGLSNWGLTFVVAEPINSKMR
jgi:hypothetical protein